MARARNSASPQFEGLLDRHFETELAGDPVAANFAGLPEGEGKLGRCSKDSLKRELRRHLATLAELDAVSPADLTPDQQLDRLALRSELARSVADHQRGLPAMRPDAIEHVLDVLFHELQRGDDEPARAATNLKALLKQIPEYLAEAAEVAIRPDPVWRKVMLETAAGAETLFDAVDAFLKVQAGSKAPDTQSARRAVERHRDVVADRKPGPDGGFAIGRDELARRVRDELGLDYSLGQIEALADAEIVRIGGLLKRACAKFGHGKEPDDVLADARAEWKPEGDLLDAYRTETGRVADAFRTADAMSFPRREELVVKPVPDFMRPLLPTAAYSSPGAFERRQRGVFWVNDMSLVKTTAAAKRKEIEQHFGLSLTAAHEAYPGHHLQFVTANRHPRKWRRLFAHSVFYEGWTLWCEQMLVDLKIDRSPWTRIQQLSDALWRCHRILVDVRLQTGRYTYRQAVRHLQTHLAFSRARAEAEINWYSSAPGVPMSYWLGRLENARLYRRLVEGRGWTLKQFNDWLLSFGTLPQSWLEKYGLD